MTLIIIIKVALKMKFKIHTLGCKVNQYESQAMSEALQKRGYEPAQGEDADIFIVNSCTVTASADQKTRQAVRRFKRNNPDSIVVLTGCMPQAYPDKAEELPQADIVLGNKNNSMLCDAIEDYLRCAKPVCSIVRHETGDKFSGGTITSFEERTRAYIKIQDGCNRFCSYCIIPTSRGRVRSKPLTELKQELEELVKNGYKEVVLVGINLSSYGSDIGLTFPDAVECADQTEGIVRVRLGSLEPDHLTQEVIDRLAKCKKLCPQFHISLQSGCDKTLRAMNRHYTAEEYRNLCRHLRTTFPDCTLTTDVMVGFAGESEEDFRESLNFVREIAFEKVHVFPYSVRKGTKAEKMPGHNSKKTKEERCQIMIEETEKLRLDFFRQQIGKVFPVLIEGKADREGYFCGYTPNYIPVKVKAEDSLCGHLAEVRIDSVNADEDCCFGTVISGERP